MLSTPSAALSRLAIQRVVISAATLMFITAIWWSMPSSDTTARSAGSARRPVTNSVSANCATVDVDRLTGDEAGGRRCQPHRCVRHVLRPAPAAQRRAPRDLRVEAAIRARAGAPPARRPAPAPRRPAPGALGVEAATRARAERGLDPAGAQHVDANVGSARARKRLGEAEEAGLDGGE